MKFMGREGRAEEMSQETIRPKGEEHVQLSSSEEN
jgi:hypothetical protein